LVGESDRKLLKAAIKHAGAEDSVRHRQVPAEAVSKWSSKLDALKKEIAEILEEEKEEKQLRQAEMELKKGQNMIEHEEEIYSRPARTWFQSGKDKSKAQALSKEQYETGTSGAPKKGKEKKTPDDKPKRDKYAGLSRRDKRRKMAMEEDDAGGESGVIRAAVRSAKKAAQPAKIGEPERRPAAISKKREKNKERKLRGKAAARIGGAFDKDLGQRRAKEGVRAKKGDVIGGMGKKKGGKRKAK